MKTAVPTNDASLKGPSGTSQGASRTSHRPRTGRLAQLENMANASHRVQAQLQLKNEMQNSGRVQKAVASARSVGDDASAVTQRAEAPNPNRTGLPDQLKTEVENLSGLSLDDVRVHYNSAQPTQLNALAYAQGNDIHVAPGQEKHLPHEAWHAVQQKQGRVRPTTQMKAGPVNDEPSLEKEADVMGEKALQAQSAGAEQTAWSGLSGGQENSSQTALPSQSAAPLQPKWLESQHDVRLKWDSLLSGLRWYFNRITNRMSFRIEADVQVPIELWREIEPLEGISRTYDEWAASGIFREGAWSHEDREVVPHDAPQPRTLQGVRMAVNAAGARDIAGRVLRGEPGLNPGFHGKNGGSSFFISQGNPYTGVGVDQGVTIEITIDIPSGHEVFQDADLLRIHVQKFIDLAVNEKGANGPALTGVAADIRRFLKKDINNPGDFGATPQQLGFESSTKFRQFLRRAREISEKHLWDEVGATVLNSASGVGLVIMAAGSHVTQTAGSFLVVAPKAILKCFVVGGDPAFAAIFEELGAQ